MSCHVCGWDGGDEAEECREENERLRSALELIAGTNGTECASPRAVARQALQGQPEKTSEGAK